MLMLHALSSFFKTLIDHEVTVELKNDIQIRGILKSVDQYLNIKLEDISVVEELKYPHLVNSVDVAEHGTMLTTATERRQECIYPWLGGEICPLAGWGGGYPVARRCYEER
jgi:small nuclear ribonucleoprotein (snRNP)-like protein